MVRQLRFNFRCGSRQPTARGQVRTKTVEALKRDAKRLAKASATRIPHWQALDRIAQREGFQNWSLLLKARNNEC